MTIQEFPLAWRWTQPSHSVLPPEVLARIRPLSSSEARDISRVAVLESAATMHHTTSDSGDVRSWLRTVQSDLQACIYVIWTREWAVQTSWDIFTEYWDDFCYPSSDDVTVRPGTGDWRLVYHHYEQFDFIPAS